jgi:hypothetical protein
VAIVRSYFRVGSAKAEGGAATRVSRITIPSGAAGNAIGRSEGDTCGSITIINGTYRVDFAGGIGSTLNGKVSAVGSVAVLGGDLKVIGTVYGWGGIGVFSGVRAVNRWESEHPSGQYRHGSPKL